VNKQGLGRGRRGRALKVEGLFKANAVNEGGAERVHVGLPRAVLVVVLSKTLSAMMTTCPALSAPLGRRRETRSADTVANQGQDLFVLHDTIEGPSLGR
jgi:hypothetical protein